VKLSRGRRLSGDRTERTSSHWSSTEVSWFVEEADEGRQHPESWIRGGGTDPSKVTRVGIVGGMCFGHRGSGSGR